MWVIDVEAAPPRVRGRLSRWALEVRAGLYVGNTSVRARDAIWAFVCEHMGSAANAVLVHDAPNPQGFAVQTSGQNRRRMVEIHGLALVQFLPTEGQRVPWDEPLDDPDPRYEEFDK